MSDGQPDKRQIALDMALALVGHTSDVEVVLEAAERLLQFLNADPDSLSEYSR